MLQAQDRVGEEATHQTEQHHRERVFVPVMLPRRINAHDPIGEPLYRFNDRVQPRSAARVQNTDEVKSQRFRNCDQGDAVCEKLKPSKGLHKRIDFQNFSGYTIANSRYANRPRTISPTRMLSISSSESFAKADIRCA